ncbi:MAG: J domain-containing protein [Oscillospiraceae bacterium]|jgi:curved DNA-binding protein CbpA|nr:J domain-containing protein [Oscillospiraceae bacterium]
MKDPYQILGVSQDATIEQIKSAYRNLAKKYHPDNYNNNPLADLAAEKMREINEAYEFIINQKKSKTKSNNSSYYNTNSYSHSNYFNIRDMINRGELQLAENTLDNTAVSQRDAEWFFLKGVVFCKKGWLNDGYNHISKACSIDPSNNEYRTVLNQLESQRRGSFEPFGGPMGGYNQMQNPGGCTCSDMCLGMLCADCCCNSIR